MAEDKQKEKEIDIKEIERIFDDLGVRPIKDRKPNEYGQSNNEDEVLTIRLSNSTNAMIMIC
jgi:hypothetical protein|nr:MAG TPA: hypothetical protein [Caudoviricetes sp.]